MDDVREITVSVTGPDLQKLQLAPGEGYITHAYSRTFEHTLGAEYEILWPGRLLPLIEKLRAINATDMGVEVTQFTLASGQIPDPTIHRFESMTAFEEWVKTADA